MAFPIAYLVLAAIVFDIPISHCFSILLTALYSITTLVALISGYGLWEMRRWAWYFFIGSQVLIFCENLNFVINFSESHHKAAAFFVVSILQFLMVFRVAKEVRVPYFFPKIRWWESNPRYRLSITSVLDRRSGEVIQGEILDLSSVGCFVKLRADLAQDETITIKFKVFGCDLSCEGDVVWTAQSTVTHPQGVGLKFGYLSKTNRRSLRRIHRKLKKISSFYRRSRYWMSQEEFVKSLEALENSY
jgi:NADH:ubiquinone oxidoreductase subunit K